MTAPLDMKTDLDHLPLRKQQELERIVDILLEEFGAKMTEAAFGRQKAGHVVKIILFGSHARGDWVEDRASGYFSDYDLLVIVNRKKFTDVAGYWTVAEDRLLRGLKLHQSVPQFIVHTLQDVNDNLKVGQYFFSDIVTQGVLLYDLQDRTSKGKPRYRLANPVPPDESAAVRMAKNYYEQWCAKPHNFLKVAQLCIKERLLNNAAFELHQATESAYNTYLLTHTLYSPPTHNIKSLRSRVEDREPTLRPLWPRNDRQSRRRFELLKRAYVEARYSPHYKITQEELDWLAERVEALIDAVDAVCQAHLEKLRA